MKTPEKTPKKKTPKNKTPKNKTPKNETPNNIQYDSFIKLSGDVTTKNAEEKKLIAQLIKKKEEDPHYFETLYTNIDRYIISIQPKPFVISTDKYNTRTTTIRRYLNDYMESSTKVQTRLDNWDLDFQDRFFLKNYKDTKAIKIKKTIHLYRGENHEFQIYNNHIFANRMLSTSANPYIARNFSCMHYSAKTDKPVVFYKITANLEDCTPFPAIYHPLLYYLCENRSLIYTSPNQTRKHIVEQKYWKQAEFILPHGSFLHVDKISMLSKGDKNVNGSSAKVMLEELVSQTSHDKFNRIWWRSSMDSEHGAPGYNFMDHNTLGMRQEEGKITLIECTLLPYKEFWKTLDSIQSTLLTVTTLEESTLRKCSEIANGEHSIINKELRKLASSILYLLQIVDPNMEFPTHSDDIYPQSWMCTLTMNVKKAASELYDYDVYKLVHIIYYGIKLLWSETIREQLVADNLLPHDEILEHFITAKINQELYFQDIADTDHIYSMDPNVAAWNKRAKLIHYNINTPFKIPMIKISDDHQYKATKKFLEKRIPEPKNLDMYPGVISLEELKKKRLPFLSRLQFTCLGLEDPIQEAIFGQKSGYETKKKDFFAGRPADILEIICVNARHFGVDVTAVGLAIASVMALQRDHTMIEMMYPISKILGHKFKSVYEKEIVNKSDNLSVSEEYFNYLYLKLGLGKKRKSTDTSNTPKHKIHKTPQKGGGIEEESPQRPNTPPRTEFTPDRMRHEKAAENYIPQEYKLPEEELKSDLYYVCGHGPGKQKIIDAIKLENPEEDDFILKGYKEVVSGGNKGAKKIKKRVRTTKKNLNIGPRGGEYIVRNGRKVYI